MCNYTDKEFHERPEWAKKEIFKLEGNIYFLDRGNRLGRTFDAFKTRWFKPSPDGIEK